MVTDPPALGLRFASWAGLEKASTTTRIFAAFSTKPVGTSLD